jgi:kinesin family protein 5
MFSIKVNLASYTTSVLYLFLQQAVLRYRYCVWDGKTAHTVPACPSVLDSRSGKLSFYFPFLRRAGGVGPEKDLSMSNVVVCARVRPHGGAKDDGEAPFMTCGEDNALFLRTENKDGGAGASLDFKLDHVFGPETTQDVMFDSLVKPMISEAVKGYNMTLFTYGQTGSGKTYTMQGVGKGDDRGIVYRTAETIFDKMSGKDEAPGKGEGEGEGKDGDTSIDRAAEEEERRRALAPAKSTLKLSCLEIYQEKLYDLMIPSLTPHQRSKMNLRIRQNVNGGVYIEGLSEVLVRDNGEFRMSLDAALRRRATGSHCMNSESSRSHLLCVLTVTQQVDADSEAGLSLSSKIHLIDLAGSEMVRKTEAQGERLNEAKHINKSLSALGNVIYALTEGGKDDSFTPHVPYRDSKLTRLLQDSLGGNAKTALILTVAATREHMSESIATLRFGERARQLRTKPRLNVDASANGVSAGLQNDRLSTMNNTLQQALAAARATIMALRSRAGRKEGGPPEHDDEELEGWDNLPEALQLSPTAKKRFISIQRKCHFCTHECTNPADTYYAHKGCLEAALAAAETAAPHKPAVAAVAALLPPLASPLLLPPVAGAEPLTPEARTRTPEPEPEPEPEPKLELEPESEHVNPVSETKPAPAVASVPKPEPTKEPEPEPEPEPEEDEEEDEEDAVEMHYRCAVCAMNQEDTDMFLLETGERLGELFGCDGNCGSLFHVRCVGLIGDAGQYCLPEGEWFCNRCSPDMDIEAETGGVNPKALSMAMTSASATSADFIPKAVVEAALARLRDEHDTMKRDRNAVLRQWQGEKKMTATMDKRRVLMDEQREEELFNVQKELESVKMELAQLRDERERARARGGVGPHPPQSLSEDGGRGERVGGGDVSSSSGDLGPASASRGGGGSRVRSTPTTATADGAEEGEGGGISGGIGGGLPLHMSPLVTTSAVLDDSPDVAQIWSPGRWKTMLDGPGTSSHQQLTPRAYSDVGARAAGTSNGGGGGSGDYVQADGQTADIESPGAIIPKPWLLQGQKPLRRMGQGQEDGAFIPGVTGVGGISARSVPVAVTTPGDDEDETVVVMGTGARLGGHDGDDDEDDDDDDAEPSTRNVARSILESVAKSERDSVDGGRQEKSRYLNPLQNRVNSLLADVEAETSSIKDMRQRKKDREDARLRRDGGVGELSKSLPQPLTATGVRGRGRRPPPEE